MARLLEPIILEQRSLDQLRWLRLHAPALASGARAGQYVLVRCADATSHDPLLRRALFVADVDPQAETAVLLYAANERGLHWLATRPAQASLDLLGPLGTPFVLDNQTRSLLLLGTGAGLAALLLLAREALARNIAVVLLVAADTPGLLPPPFLLPAEVEYQVSDAGADGLLDLVTPTLLGWADQVAVTLPLMLVPRLVAQVRAAKLHWQPGFAQLALARSMPCGTGACRACLVETREGMRTCCKDGPVFDLRNLR